MIPILRFTFSSSRVSCSSSYFLSTSKASNTPARQFASFTSNTIFAFRRPRLRTLQMSRPYTAPAAAADPSKIRPSASVCLLNSRNQVLLVQRTASASSFANTHVFPGGNLDPQDNGSYEMCAIRELFEEAGVLLTTPTSATTLTEEQLDEARKGVHSGKLNFAQWLKDNNLQADVNALKRFTTWITPATMKKRYNTRMYLAFLPTTTAQEEGGGGREDKLPKHDGGVEIISTSYRSPASALKSMHSREILLFPPQTYLLSRLAEFIPHATEDAVSPAEVRKQREDVLAWLSGPEGVGEYVFRPELQGRIKDGRRVEAYGPDGDHDRRTLWRLGKDGVPSDIYIIGKEEAAELLKTESSKL